MSMLKTHHLCPLWQVCIILGVVTGGDEGITDDCLGCICEAASGCETSTRCLSSGLCGLFHISWPYWADAGKLSIQGATKDDGKLKYWSMFKKTVGTVLFLNFKCISLRLPLCGLVG